MITPCHSETSKRIDKQDATCLRPFICLNSKVSELVRINCFFENRSNSHRRAIDHRTCAPRELAKFDQYLDVNLSADLSADLSVDLLAKLRPSAAAVGRKVEERSRSLEEC